MEKIKLLIIAIRPWSFSASLTPVLLGSSLAYNELIMNKEVNFNFVVFFLCLICALCVHGAGNLVNTYYDFKTGIDNKETQSDRILVDKLLTTSDITKLGKYLFNLKKGQHILIYRNNLMICRFDPF
jgi:1,4-dihydroxy-2-naphthoate octaprenyltransferase